MAPIFVHRLEDRALLFDGGTPSANRSHTARPEAHDASHGLFSSPTRKGQSRRANAETRRCRQAANPTIHYSPTNFNNMELFAASNTTRDAAAEQANLNATRIEEAETKGIGKSGLHERTPVTNYVVRRLVQLARDMREAQKIARTAPTRVNQNIADRATQTFDRLLYAMVESDGVLYRLTAEPAPTPMPAPPPTPPKPVSIPDDEPEPGPSSEAEQA